METGALSHHVHTDDQSCIQLVLGITNFTSYPLGAIYRSQFAQTRTALEGGRKPEHPEDRVRTCKTHTRLHCNQDRAQVSDAAKQEL